MTNEIKKFKVGTTYTTNSVCDSNSIFTFTVIKRTAKQITFTEKLGRTRRKGVSVYNNEEICFPYGKYSMAVSFGANDCAEGKEARKEEVKAQQEHFQGDRTKKSLAAVQFIAIKMSKLFQAETIQA